MFREDLIGFIMLYIKFSEETGILSDNQRVGVITLYLIIPKGTKVKKNTLYKLFRTILTLNASTCAIASPHVCSLASLARCVESNCRSEIKKIDTPEQPEHLAD